MGAIRTSFWGVATAGAALTALPARAQTAAEPRAPFVAEGETRVTLDERGRGLWLRAATVARARDEASGGPRRAGYRVSLQKHIAGPAWIGLGASGQLPRFDPVRGQIRGGRNAVGGKLSVEAGADVEMGVGWMKRIRGRGPSGPKPGPRAYVQFAF